MTLRAFVKAEKALVDAGSWSDKRMPKTGGKFPLSKSKNFRVGAPGWRWRVVQVEADAKPYRVLVLYHAGKQNYFSIVGTPVGSDLLILGCLENHSTHPGWHVHAGCKPPVAVDSGRLRYPGMRKASFGSAKNAAVPFPLDDRAALEIAASYFKLPPLPSNEAVQVPMVYPGGVS